MVKAIFFDFWGTLVENGVYPSPVRQVKNILRLYKTPFPEYIVKFEHAFMTQDFKDLYHAFTNVCKEFDVSPTKHTLDKLVGMWNKNKLLAKPYKDTISSLKKLKKDYKIVLISNTDSFSLKSVMEKYEMKSLFDLINLSCQRGMLKSDPKMFEYALKKLKLEKDEVIMVGDSIPSDIRGAKKAGIKPILIDRNNRRKDFEDRILNLEELNKFLED